MSDLTATNCSTGCACDGNNNNIFFILLILFFCGGCGCNGSSIFSSNGNNCGCEFIIILILLFCCGNGSGCFC